MADDIFDFGFTTASEQELEDQERKKLRKEQKAVEQKHVNKAQRLYDMILPLLDNLRANPEKEWIYWPNREEKIDEFESKLVDILNED